MEIRVREWLMVVASELARTFGGPYIARRYSGSVPSLKIFKYSS
jgi:hypothetical protein